MRVAWHPFGDEPEEVEQATMSMKNLVKELASKGFSPDESFYTLCESSLMERTLCQDAGGSYLHAELLEFHRAQKPEQTLQSFADELFETTTARYSIIRILYYSDAKQPIDNCLRSFVPQLSSEDASSSTPVRVKKYALLVRVRLNDANHKNDYVRTYSFHGPNIIAEYEPPSFMAHRWSIRDAPVKYMLIYGLHESWSNDPTNFACHPEVATHPISQDQIPHIRGVFDDFKEIMAALRASETESESTDTNLAGDSQQSVPEYKDRRILLDGLYRPKHAWEVKESSPGYGSDRPTRSSQHWIL
ncbi:hypothetical protein H9Q69_005698 [Fusarium xylarioides]|nr:hypothetical protein H9Q69_005698 [Fusarium xylarioides]